jgi:hypothetical protein
MGLPFLVTLLHDEWADVMDDGRLGRHLLPYMDVLQSV